jgi:PHD/YefM family antitoxin component YafN of YafNO toxin-antitoxin module
MSLEDFASWEETHYLLKSPRNAERLMAAISRFEAGEWLDKSELLSDREAMAAPPERGGAKPQNES